MCFTTRHFYDAGANSRYAFAEYLSDVAALGGSFELAVGNDLFLHKIPKDFDPA